MSIAHTAPISGVSTHEGFICTAGYDNQVILWDAKSHVAVARGFHDHLANQCEFSPDGTMVVSAGSDGSARLWSLPDMRLVRVLAGHTDDVMKAAYSPDGQSIATCSYDGTLRAYDLYGNETFVFRGHKGLIETFDWASDSLTLVSSGTDGTVKTWCAKTGTLLNNRSGFEHDLDTLVAMADGTLFVGGDDGSIVGFTDSDRSTTQAHRSGVKRLVARGDLLLSLGYDQQCAVWKRQGLALTEIARSTFPSHIWARAAAFINDAEVAFGTFGSTYAVWNRLDGTWTSDGYAASISLNSVTVGAEGVRYAIGDAGILFREGVAIGGPGSLCNCSIESNGRVFAAGHLGTIYDVTAGASVYSASAPINCVTRVPAPMGDILVFGTYKGSLLVFRSEGPQLHHFKTIDLGCNAIKGVCQGRGVLFCGSADGTLSILDAHSLEVRHRIQNAHDGILNGVAPYADGFGTISRDKTLRLWDDDGRCKRVVPSRHKHSIKCIASNTDGSLLATGSYGGSLDVYSVATGTWIGKTQRPTTSGISSLTWDERTSRFLASSYDGSVYEVAA